MPVYGAPEDVSVIFNAGFSTPAVLTTRSTAVSATHIKTLQIYKLNGNEYFFYCRVNRSTFSNIMNTILDGIIM